MMTRATLENQKKIVKYTIASMMLISGAIVSLGEARAYDLQPNTIYANAQGGIYRIDLALNSAIRVAETNASLSSVQDVAFDGDTLYGINLNWQLLKLEPSRDETVAVNQATSFSLQFQGLEARDGVLYGAELRSLVRLDQATGNPVAGSGLSSYGLGAGEKVSDLAFDDDGTLYATVDFPGLESTFLGTVDTTTGALNIIGITGTENLLALTVKDGVLYAMNSSGDLYTLDKVSGFATEVARAVLPGVKGMDTSPASSGSAVVAAGDGGAGGGSLSVYGLLIMVLSGLLRRIRNA